MSELKRLRTAFERIHKVLIAKLESGDDQTIFTELDWLEKQISSLFKLAETNLPKFETLVDPTGLYKGFEYDKESDTDGAGKPQNEGFSIDFEVVYPEKDVLDTLTGMLYQIMTRALEMGSLDVYAKARALLAQLYRNIALSQLHKLNFSGLYSELLTRFMSMISRELGKPTKSLSHKTILPFMAFDMHLHFLHEDDFALELIEAQVFWLYQVAQIHIDAESDESIKQLIRTLADYGTGHQKPHTEALELFFAAYREKHPPDSVEWLLKPFEIHLVALSQGLFSKMQLDLFLQKLERLKYYFGQNPEQGSDELTREVEKLEAFAISRFKFRQLQRLLIKVLAYAVFRKKYHLLDYAFHLTQPEDADHLSIFSGEVVLSNLGHLLGHLLVRESIETELRHSWPDYHGIKTYLDHVFIRSLTHWAEWRFLKEQYYPLSDLIGLIINSNTPYNISQTSQNLKNQLRGLMQSMLRLSETDKHLSLKEHRYRLERLIDELLDLLNGSVT